MRPNIARTTSSTYKENTDSDFMESSGSSPERGVKKTTKREWGSDRPNEFSASLPRPKFSNMTNGSPKKSSARIPLSEDNGNIVLDSDSDSMESSWGSPERDVKRTAGDKRVAIRVNEFSAFLPRPNFSNKTNGSPKKSSVRIPSSIDKENVEDTGLSPVSLNNTDIIPMKSNPHTPRSENDENDSMELDLSLSEHDTKGTIKRELDPNCPNESFAPLFQPNSLNQTNCIPIESSIRPAFLADKGNLEVISFGSRFPNGFVENVARERVSIRPREPLESENFVPEKPAPKFGHLSSLRDSSRSTSFRPIVSSLRDSSRSTSFRPVISSLPNNPYPGPKRFGPYITQNFAEQTDLAFQGVHINESTIVSALSKTPLNSLVINDCTWEPECNLHLAPYGQLKILHVSLYGFKGQLTPPSGIRELVVQVPVYDDIGSKPNTRGTDILLDLLDCTDIKHL
jgi:hypothetical protein